MRFATKVSNRLGRLAVRLARIVLRDPQVRQQLWEVTYRPGFSDLGGKDLWLTQFELAAADSANYAIDHMITAKKLERYDLMELSLSKCEVDGLYLEFGSGYSGRTTRFIAGRIPGELHGFDSFEGLPEAWFGDLGQGSLPTDESQLQYPSNVRLHKGWFNETLPGFVAGHTGPVAFMHVDCDVYSSTRDILDALRDRIVQGTVIQFDEYFNYPGWRLHEFRAFQEFVTATNRRYEYLGYARRGFCAAVRMLS